MTPDAAPPPTPPSAARPWGIVSHWARRSHMYLALFLTPWMLMYALSTFVMSHREWVTSFYRDKQPAYVTERELDYSRALPPDATPQQIGRQILEDLGLGGAHRVSGGQAGKPLVVDRFEALAQRRITFHRDTGKLVLQREEFRGPTFLERMHRRRGYQQDRLADDTWAFTVDLAMVAAVFWCLSGIWLWWEQRPTRRWGAASAALGWISFACFLLWL